MAHELTFFSQPMTAPDGEYETLTYGVNDERLVALYPNGYGASIVRNHMSYGGRDGKYELALLHDEDELCYRTAITSDVIGWLEPEQVIELLERIAALGPDLDCDHDKPDTWDPLGDPDDEHQPSFFDALDSMARGR